MGPGPSHISNSDRQLFRFTLAPGRYVLAGRYGHGNGLTYYQVAVTAGKVVHKDLPNDCK